MKIQYFLTLLILPLFFGSCATHNIFQESTRNHNNVETLMLEAENEYHLKTDDKISVSVWNHKEISIGSIFDIYNANEVYGRWVMLDNEGKVVLPKIGQITLGGLTISEAQVKLNGYYSEYIKDSSLVVKVLNREATVLGEVQTPGVYLLEKSQNSILEMIGRAEGMLDYADMRAITLIRNDKKYVIDMSKTNDIQLASINVLNGDVIYVPSRKGKVFDKKAPTIIPFATLATSIALVTSVILTKRK